jgi:hypothetical protein
MRYALAALLFACVSCSDGATTPALTHVDPAEVRWVEWPFQVTSALGESLRAIVYVPCGYPHVAVTSPADSILVQADDEHNADGSCLGTGNGIYDTILPLPEFHPAEPPELLKPVPYFVVARMHNFPSPGLVPVILGPLELTFRPPFEPIRRVGGLIELERDIDGCSWAMPLGLRGEPYLLINPPQLDPAGYPYQALIGGIITHLDPPVCGQAFGITLSFARVDVRP